MTPIQFTLHIVVAVLLGAAIGLERQWRQRLAGLRTNALVSMGAAAFVALSLLVGQSADPTRIAAQVVSGIGFLGGGIILREGLNVRGLNTAATLWCSAAVGSLAGMGHLIPALATALIVVAANTLLRPLALLVNRQPPASTSEVETAYLVEVTCREDAEQRLRGLLLQEAASDAVLLKSLESQDIDGSTKVRVQAELTTSGRSDRLMERIVSRLSMEQGTTAISWRVVAHESPGS
jgi:putative Mg2+ transporter-C (MgtC) family protein